LTLLEEKLPARFGGRAGDYQLVEREHDGLVEVSLVVSPSVGSLDDDFVVRFTIERLRAGLRYHRMMADVWAGAGVLRVERREPYAVNAKVLPLHLLR
jgi:hypothetical protein